MRIDSHQHFWVYDAVRDAWINDDMKAIQRNFLPTDLAPVLRANNIDGTVAVQASESPEETQFLVDLSSMYALIKGVVGWVDLESDQIEEQLERFRSHKVVKGYRHVIQGEEDPNYLTRPAFLRGIKALTKYGYTYDLLIHPRHFESTLSCVAQNPEQRFVLDHMAKPAIKVKAFKEWAAFMEKLSTFPNVYCKISGLVTEADWENWTIADFQPYIQHVIHCFGKDRVMFGTDWPVCQLAASYEQVIEIVETALVDFSEAEKAAFFGGNAARFYGI